MGLGGAVTPADLDAVEAQLCPQGRGARQMELCPFADPSLAAELARRGYRVHEWQLVWTRGVPDAPSPPRPRPETREARGRGSVEPWRDPPPALRLAPMAAGQEDLFLRVIMAGFLEREEVPDAALALMRPLAFAAQHERWLCWLGDEPIGGANLAWADGVAFLGGSGVRPAFRRRGAQGALIRARLDRARALGCDLVCSNTQPGTASRRNMERHGFTVAYPKLVMLRDD
jgi:GNAT superfamily N-acetyltransferase